MTPATTRLVTATGHYDVCAAHGVSHLHCIAAVLGNDFKPGCVKTEVPPAGAVCENCKANEERSKMRKSA